jgi:hypothetical protein
MARTARWFVVVFFWTSLCVAQTDQKIANINKKVLGKWWTADRKSYIEFGENGSCSEGDFYTGSWHVQKGKLFAWQTGDSFMCNSGALTLIGPDVFTRDHGMGGEPVKYYRELERRKPMPSLTLALARQLLAQNINLETANNTLLTCRACYDPKDKAENENAPLVSIYPGPLVPFLVRAGYIRNGGNRQVFTAKAKKSADYGPAGLRVANFSKPRILDAEMRDPRQVPIEYELTPTASTLPFFGKVQRIRSVARFSYENETWHVCIACQP